MRQQNIGRFASCASTLFLAALILPAWSHAQTRGSFTVNPLSVAVETPEGENAPSRTVALVKTGSGALKWSVQPTVSWLSVSPARGTNNATLTLAFQTNTLAVGQHATTFRIESTAGTSVTVPVTVNVLESTPPPPPPPDPTYGPRASITCPAGAIDISPGTNIQVVVDFHPGASTFCLTPGVHSITNAITPKTGNTFVGEYGAILDGAGWTTTDPDQGAFRSQVQDIDDVTVRNLVIRNMPQKAFHVHYVSADRWTIEYNEITGNRTGVSVANNSVVRHNAIHHNSSGGYTGFRAVNTLFENNEIAYNGAEQKMLYTVDVTFRNNYVHHNVSDGIWFDTDNRNTVIEGNRVEDQGRNGIFYEISDTALIRNNTVLRSGEAGIFISTAKNVEIRDNTLQDNFRGIWYFLNCDAIGDGIVVYDLANNNAHDNIIRVGTTSGAFANGFGYLAICTSTQAAPYVNGSKNLKFTNNTYYVPSLATKYWVWGLNGLRFWSEWQALGHDTTGAAHQQ